MATPIPVKPVIAIPGWMVNRQGKGVVSLLNAKELARSIPRLGIEPLSEERVRQIADRIEERCRDIEGV